MEEALLELRTCPRQGKAPYLLRYRDTCLTTVIPEPRPLPPSRKTCAAQHYVTRGCLIITCRHTLVLAFTAVLHTFQHLLPALASDFVRPEFRKPAARRHTPPRQLRHRSPRMSYGRNRNHPQIPITMLLHIRPYGDTGPAVRGTRYP
jgi:hypothetical protein